MLPDLESHIGYWLRRVSNEVSGSFARALHAEQVSVAEWVALRLLHDEGRLTPGRLAERMAITRGAVSKVLDKLESKGCLARTGDRGDSRVQWVSLTREGARLVPKLARIADRNDAQFFGCLDADEQLALRRLLEKLTEFHRLRGAPVD